MRPPLENWNSIERAYEQGDWTFYGTKHRGVDYMVPEGTKIFAPADGQIILQTKFIQGGNTIWYKFEDKGQKYIMRCLHLQEPESVWIPFENSEGNIIGHTGNTGMSTGPHLHLDLSKNKVEIFNFKNFIDPDEFFGKDDMMKLCVIGIDVYAIGKDNKRHLIFNSETFNEGIKLGLWNDDKSDEMAENYKEGHSIILLSDE